MNQTNIHEPLHPCID